jgi:hypothetical protein
MRKDFIQSAEVKLNRKKRLEENRINTSKRLSISESIDSSHHSSNSESVSQILEDFDSVRFYLKNFFDKLTVFIFSS